MAAPSAESTSPIPAPERSPVLYRSRESSVVAGVCDGIARHLNWPVLPIRVGFVLLGAQLVGVIIYGVLWLLVPINPQRTAQPGLAAAERRGMRPARRVSGRRHDVGALIALFVLGAGLFTLGAVAGVFGAFGNIMWPLVFAVVGFTLIWRQADAATIREVERDTRGNRWLTPLVLRGRSASAVRLVIGVALIAASYGGIVSQQVSGNTLPVVLGTSLLAVAGVGMLLAPWVLRFRANLYQAREDKVRADERADVAAHLHDSVLQTLALIQRQADDPKAVQTLARRQERELRTWLYGDTAEAATFKTALTEAASEIEDERGISVELVVVGDCPVDDDVDAVIRAAREALMNAAKHSGADEVDVYAEASEDIVEVFIRDRGVGFDTDSIADDRMGVRRSIVNRMERHGGAARIRSVPGEGTEVRLELKK